MKFRVSLTSRQVYGSPTGSTYWWLPKHSCTEGPSSSTLRAANGGESNLNKRFLGKRQMAKAQWDPPPEDQRGSAPRGTLKCGALTPSHVPQITHRSTVPPGTQLGRRQGKGRDLTEAGDTRGVIVGFSWKVTGANSPLWGQERGGHHFATATAPAHQHWWTSVNTAPPSGDRSHLHRPCPFALQVHLCSGKSAWESALQAPHGEDQHRPPPRIKSTHQRGCKFRL